MTKKAATPVAEVTTPVAETEAPTIKIDDLAHVLKIIDASSKRGAWSGEELSYVGGIRDKLAVFLAAVAPATPSEAPAAE